MRNSHVASSVINLLRQPFIQRLITLAISTLLAVSLTCVPIALVLHASEHQTAFYPSHTVFTSPLMPELSGTRLSYESLSDQSATYSGRRGA